MDWIVILLLGLGGGVVGAILKRIFKLSERLALIISMSISLLFVIIYIDNTMTLIPKQNYTGTNYPTINYTGNPKSDAQILNERVADYGYDFDAAYNELLEVYSDKGLGMQNVKETLLEATK